MTASRGFKIDNTEKNSEGSTMTMPVLALQDALYRSLKRVMF